MTQKGILVTGGAGYIGSHVVKQLGKLGERIIVLDNLSTGSRNSVLYGEFVKGDIGDRDTVRKLLHEYEIDSVMHFAANTVVSESIENPLKYYANNTCCTRNLLECCTDANIRHFIFSSTAAVYGIPQKHLIQEDDPQHPITPYGASKLMSERMLRDVSNSSCLRHVILRYFNVAGSDPDGQIGQSTKKAALLIKAAAETAIGKRSHLHVFGTDYPTHDGTGVRDYIHVTDLASVHIEALNYLRQGGNSETMNCGYGHGYSVKQVINSVNRVNGSAITVVEQERRPGDPPVLVADIERIRNTLCWEPKYDDLDFIIKTSLDWERKNLGGVSANLPRDNWP